MKICIDISQIVYGTGVSDYTEDLVKNLLAIDSQNEYVLFGGSLRQIPRIKYLISRFEGRFVSKILPIPPTLADLIWNRIHKLQIENLVGNIDVFHSSDWTQPPSKAFKVTTVHDISPILSRAFSKKDLIRNIPKTHAARLKWVKKEVDRIIVPSNATKKDLVNSGGR